MDDARHIPITIKKSVPSPWKVRVPSRLGGHTQSTSLRAVAPALPLWMIMFRSRSATLRVIALFLIVALNATGLAQTGLTTAYLFDEETSTGNTFTVGVVDFMLTNSAFAPTSTALNLSPGTTTSKVVLATMNDVANPTQYYASSTNFTGDQAFCADLDATIGTTSTLYNGKLTSLFSATSTASSSMVEPWSLALSLPATSTQVNSYCAFDTDFNGWQTRHNYPKYPDALSDTETVSHKVTSWGLRINKVYYDVDDSEAPPINLCLPEQPQYWANNFGCTNGNGSSDYVGQINAFSSGFSSVFATATGAQICKATVTTSCPSSATTAGKRCRAKQYLVGTELATVSGNLDLDAIIAGTDDDSLPFDRLGLSGTSTIRQLIITTEAIIANATSTGTMLVDAKKVLERLTLYYSDMDSSPNHPYCIYNGNDFHGRGQDTENEWVELYNQTNQPVDLSSWQLCNQGACDALLGASTTIPANGYAIITGSTTTFNYWNIPNDIVKVVLPDGAIGTGLDDGSDMLLLKRPDGYPIDQMNYGTSSLLWPNANADLWNPMGVVDASQGHLLGRKPTGYDTDQVSDWTDYVPPHVELIYPTPYDGLYWNWDETHLIEWSATNPNGPDSALMIDLFYIIDSDHSTSISTADTIYTIATSSPNDGNELWTIPSGFIGWVWIKLVATGPENPLNNTMVASGKIWDPPVVLNELWGVEQETQPIDDEYYEEEEVVEEVADESETPLLDESATSTDTTASTTESETVPTGGSTDNSEGGTGVPPTSDESTPQTSTTTDEVVDTATSSEESLPDTENASSTPVDTTASSTETTPVDSTASSTEETVPVAPLAPTTEQTPPAPVDTEAREEDVSGGVATPEVPPEPEPVPPPLQELTPTPDAPVEAPAPAPESAPVTPAE